MGWGMCEAMQAAGIGETADDGSLEEFRENVRKLLADLPIQGPRCRRKHNFE